jgi:hypothetical protein
MGGVMQPLSRQEKGDRMQKMTNKLTTTQKATTLCFVIALGYLGNSNAEDTSKLPPPSSQSGVSYTKDIKAILDASCVKCHGAEKPKGKLRLDTLAGILKGGEDGKVIKPGNSADSNLVKSIARVGNPDLFMPPPKNKANIEPLTAQQIGLIRAWIDQGAK